VAAKEAARQLWGLIFDRPMKMIPAQGLNNCEAFG
jgi:hypothetical protein